MKRKLFALALASCMICSLAACSGGEKPSGGTQTPPPPSSASQQPTGGTSSVPETPTYEPATVRVAYMPNLGSAGSLFVGIEQGYFEEVGLTVQTFEFQGGPAEIAVMGSKDIDIAQIGHGAHALCIEGQAVIFQMDHTTSLSDEVIANRSKGIEKAEDLKGKTVAVGSGTSSEIILHEVLSWAGLTLDDVNTVEMTNDGMTTAMIGNQVDACAAWSPNTVILKEAMGDNYLKLGGNADFLDEAIFPSSYITTKDYADANRDILVRFATALNKAHDYRNANQEEMAKLLAAKLDAPEDTMVQSIGEADWDTITKICGDMASIKTVYETQQKVFIENGRITEEVPAENYVLFDVMQEAYNAYSK